MFWDMGPHISDLHTLCFVNILSLQHTQAYNLVDCQHNWAGTNTHPVRLLVYTDCLAHMGTVCKDLQARLAQLC